MSWQGRGRRDAVNWTTRVCVQWGGRAICSPFLRPGGLFREAVQISQSTKSWHLLGGSAGLSCEQPPALSVSVTEGKGCTLNLYQTFKATKSSSIIFKFFKINVHMFNNSWFWFVKRWKRNYGRLIMRCGEEWSSPDTWMLPVNTFSKLFWKLFLL